MSLLKLAMYILLSCLTIVHSQTALIGAQKDLRGVQVASRLREVLYGLAVYTLNHWGNLTAAIPAPIPYKDVVTGNMVNVGNIFSPTASELMQLGFLAAPTPGAGLYPDVGLGGVGTYRTSIAINPAGCSGSACSSDLDVYLMEPVAQWNGQFDIRLTSTAVNDRYASVGYTYPDAPALFKGPNLAWTHALAPPIAAQSGRAMVHTSDVQGLLTNQLPTESAGWKAPVSTVADLPTAQANAIGDIRLVTSTGVPYFWQGLYWNALYSLPDSVTSLGPSAGNTNTSSVYIGASSGKKYRVD